MNKQTILKVAGVIVPLLVALAGILYGDVTPTVRAICEAALPAGTMVKEVDAGAAR